MTEIKSKSTAKLNNQIKPNLYAPKNQIIFNSYTLLKNNTLAEKKEILLEKLKSKTKPNSYKRYLGTPLRYAGGKSLAVGHIVNLLPNNIEKVVSPFLGGASVEIALAKELDLEVIGYDIFDILINY